MTRSLPLLLLLAACPGPKPVVDCDDGFVLGPDGNCYGEELGPRDSDWLPDTGQPEGDTELRPIPVDTTDTWDTDWGTAGSAATGWWTGGSGDTSDTDWDSNATGILWVTGDTSDTDWDSNATGILWVTGDTFDTDPDTLGTGWWTGVTGDTFDTDWATAATGLWTAVTADTGHTDGDTP